MICSKCGKNEGKFDTKFGFLCSECYESYLNRADKSMIKCSECGKTIISGDYYATSEDNKTFCARCFTNNTYTSNKTNTTTDVSNKAIHILSTTLYIIAVIIIVLGIFIGIANYSSYYGHNNMPVALYICGGIVSGALMLGIGKIVEAAELYIWKNK